MTRLLSSPLRAALTTLGLLAIGGLGFALVSGDSGSDSDPSAGTAAEDTTQPAGADPEIQADADPDFQRALERHEASKQPEETKEEKQAREAAEGLYALVGGIQVGEGQAIDSAAFCELMSKDARRETVAYVRRTAEDEGQWSCPAAIAELTDRAREAGGLTDEGPAEVIAIKAQGDRATARVRYAGAVSRVVLVREDGEWRLASSPTK